MMYYCDNPILNGELLENIKKYNNDIRLNLFRIFTEEYQLYIEKWNTDLRWFVHGPNGCCHVCNLVLKETNDYFIIVQCSQEDIYYKTYDAAIKAMNEYINEKLKSSTTEEEKEFLERGRLYFSNLKESDIESK